MTSKIRDRSPLASLEDPKRSIPAGEQDIRLDDYLNDKIQTASDFDSLEALLASVETQRIQLEDQLQDAVAELKKAKDAASSHIEFLLQQTQSFHNQQESINKRLAIVSASESPHEAVQKFKRPMEKLRKVELAQAYVDLLKEVDDLTAEARSNLPNDPKEALKPYTRLKQLSAAMRPLQAPAEEAGVHIVKYIEERAESLWDEMKTIMSNELQDVLKKNNWPSPKTNLDQEWSDCFEKLLDLQTPELLTAQSPLILLPMAVMVKEFTQMFRYHFMSPKPTNSQSSPEIFFNWTIETIKKWDEVVCENVGPILITHFRGSKLANNTAYTDPSSAFIIAFLPVVKEKIDTLIPIVAQDPSALSNFMVLLMKFDDDIREVFGYTEGDSENGWKGLTEGVLDVWFNRWLQVEKDFDLERYQAIISAPKNGEIDYDSTVFGKTKATHGALKVADLLSNITMQYRSVRKFSYKLRFLIDVQLGILDQYHNRLKESLDVYIARTSTVGRTLHSVTKEQQAELEGTGGLKSLCKVYGSSEHILTTLYDWSCEMFFVELWSELQKRAKNTGVNAKFTESMSYADVRNSTSASVGSDYDDSDGGLFEETITAFRGRRDQAERLMVDALKYSLNTAFRPYVNKAQWLTVDDGSGAMANPSLLNVTAELDGPIQTLSRNMEFLSKALSTAAFRRIWHPVVAALQDLLWAEVLMRERFTALGAAQFMRDLLAIWGVIDTFITDGSSALFGMPKLKEGAQLLNLPMESTNGSLSLTDAYNQVFADNTEAKKVVDSLGFDTLNYIEARQVLQRRVEATSDD